MNLGRIWVENQSLRQRDVELRLSKREIYTRWELLRDEISCAEQVFSLSEFTSGT